MEESNRKRKALAAQTAKSTTITQIRGRLAWPGLEAPMLQLQQQVLHVLPVPLWCRRRLKK